MTACTATGCRWAEAANSVWACRRAIYVAAETAGRTAVVECVVLAVACLIIYWR